MIEHRAHSGFQQEAFDSPSRLTRSAHVARAMCAARAATTRAATRSLRAASGWLIFICGWRGCDLCAADSRDSESQTEGEAQGQRFDSSHGSVLL